MPPHLAALEDPRPDPSAHIPRHLIRPADEDGHFFIRTVTEEVVDNLLKVGPSAVFVVSAAAAHVLQLDGRRIVAHEILCEVEVDVVVVQERFFIVVAARVGGHGPGCVGGGADSPDEVDVGRRGGGEVAPESVVEREGKGGADAACDEEGPGGAPCEEVLELFAYGAVGAFYGEGDCVGGMVPWVW